jgi:hypothetical protein
VEGSTPYRLHNFRSEKACFHVPALDGPPWAKAAERPVAGLKPQDVASVSELVAETERTADTPDFAAVETCAKSSRLDKNRKSHLLNIAAGKVSLPPWLKAPNLISAPAFSGIGCSHGNKAPARCRR